MIKVFNNFKIILIGFTLIGFVGCGKQRSVPTPTAQGDTASPTNTPVVSVQNPGADTSQGSDVSDPSAPVVADTQTPEEKPVTYAEVLPIFKTHCSVCHPSINPNDWSDYKTAKAFVDNGGLYERIWTLKDDPAKGMPLGATDDTFPPALRKRIKDWIDGGGLQ